MTGIDWLSVGECQCVEYGKDGSTCVTRSCVDELAVALVAVYGAQIFAQNFQEIALPYVLKRMAQREKEEYLADLEEKAEREVEREKEKEKEKEEKTKEEEDEE